jgi:hypothetical protein
MKIAICYSGMARTILETFSNHKKTILDNYDCDVFFSFWDCWGHGNVNIKYQSSSSDCISPKDKELICNLLNPTNFEFESFEDKEPILRNLISQYNQEFPYCKNVLSMHYKIFKSMQLVKSSQCNYDIVLRIRPDHIIVDPIKFKPIHENSFYTSLLPARCNISGVNDQIGYGDMDSMSLYSNLFCDFEKIFFGVETFNPEVVFKKYLDYVNLKYLDDENLNHWILNKDNNLR